MQIHEVSFSDAIRDTTLASRTLLLGNGFSISLCESFAYEYLYNKAKNPSEHWACCTGSHLDNLFSSLKTSDFEMVLAHLNIAIKVAECYSMLNVNYLCRSATITIADSPSVN